MVRRLQQIRRLFTAITGAALLAFGPSGSVAQQQKIEVTVDPGQRFQVMTGWEVAGRSLEYYKKQNRFGHEWHAFSDDIFDVLVNEIGINRIRIPLRSGLENTVDYWNQFEKGQLTYKEIKRKFYHKINDNDDPNTINPAGFQFGQLDYIVKRMVLPMMERAKANGERIYLNLCFVDFDKGKNITRYNHAQNPAEYAELVTAAFMHLKATYGIVPDALEVILEPDHTARWNNGGGPIGEAAIAAVRRLNAAGFHPELILPSTKNAEKAPHWFDAAMRVPGLAPHVGALAYHRYARAKPQFIAKIKETAARHGKRVEMLEYVPGNTSHLVTDLHEANASAWQSYAIAGWRREDRKPARGAMVYVERDTGKAYPSHQGMHLMQYMRYVRLGAQRIGASSSVAGAEPTAFENKDGGQVVVVKTSVKGPITVRGMKPGDYAATYASWKSGGNALPVVRNSADGSLTVDMPVKGEVSIFPAHMAR